MHGGSGGLSAKVDRSPSLLFPLQITFLVAFKRDPSRLCLSLRFYRSPYKFLSLPSPFLCNLFHVFFFTLCSLSCPPARSLALTSLHNAVLPAHLASGADFGKAL